jgi:hypothetical protein
MSSQTTSTTCTVRVGFFYKTDAMIVSMRSGAFRGLRVTSAVSLQMNCSQPQTCLTVVVNISLRGSAAIILSHGSVQHIDLPLLTYEEAETWLQKPLDGPSEKRRSRNKDFTKFLKWLWISESKKSWMRSTSSIMTSRYCRESGGLDPASPAPCLSMQ